MVTHEVCRQCWKPVVATFRPALGSIMIPASVLMAVSVYDRASDWMYPRFFGIFCSSCLSAHQVEAEPALKAGCGLVAPSNHSTFHRASSSVGVSCAAFGRNEVEHNRL
jgi:hypothetical protein